MKTTLEKGSSFSLGIESEDGITLEGIEEKDGSYYVTDPNHIVLHGTIHSLEATNLSLTELIIIQPTLSQLNCNDNQLIALDLSHCPNIAIVDCSVNELKSLDVSGCKKLWTLFCPQKIQHFCIFQIINKLRMNKG